MVNIPDPVGAGLVANLARPGGNVTGLSRQSRDLIGKNCQLLREALPTTIRLGLLVNPKTPLSHSMIGDAKAAAAALGMQLTVAEADAPAEVERAFSILRREKVEAVFVLGGAGFYLNRRDIARLALHNRLPSMFQNREFVEAGGLLSYAPSTTANYRRAAFFVDKILRGAKPGELPVEQPTQFELALNLKTARALGLTLPPSLLMRADEVIE